MIGKGREVPIDFDDGLAYERFMGRWSRAAGVAFLAWLAPPKRARWLEIGCGTGAFTDLVLRVCSPELIVATDPAASQIEVAERQLDNSGVVFRIARAERLPVPDDSFDVIAAALVLNFLPDRKRALGEMRRVGRLDATVAAYIWDFAAEQAPNSCLTRGLRHMGIEVPRVPGSGESTLDALTSAFEAAGFGDVAATSFDVTVEFHDFDEFWRSQTPSFSPLSKIIGVLSAAERQWLGAWVQGQSPNGRAPISLSARVNAIRARVR